MIRHLSVLTSVLLLCLTSICQRATAQVEKVDYLWLVDVSGQRNIYLEGIQHAIDTFYVVATKHDVLHVYNFAKTVATKDDVVDGDFYEYSDMGRMLQALDSLIRGSRSRYVRAFVLSDFFHHSPEPTDEERLNPEVYADIRNDLDEVCRVKNVGISLMVLPPSTNEGRYAIDEVQAVLPTGCTDVFGVSPDHKTVDYLVNKVEEMNQWRGVKDETTDVSSPLATYIVLGLFLLALAGLAIYLMCKKTILPKK